MQRRRVAQRRPRLCRFIKSYKYKHKASRPQVRIARGSGSRKKCQNGSLEAAKVEIKFLAICDSTAPDKQEGSRRWPIATEAAADSMSRQTWLVAGRQPPPPPRIRHWSASGPQSGSGASSGASLVSKWLMLAALICFTQQQHLFPVAQAFCPSVKCVCDDRLLSANCTNVPSISHIPVTLNPLLRRLTLRQLALVELSNSLAVYRQLEWLDLRSNHLRQLRYENFNFRSAPASVVLSMRPWSHPLNSSPSQQAGSPSSPLIEEARHQELRDNNELLARHLKLSIDKSLSEDEIRFHLRELYLADNRIEQLGSGPSDVDEEEEDSFEEQQPGQSAEVHRERASSRRLRAGDLERMAPFLSLSKLEVLDLSSNRLRRLHQHVFLGLVHLRHLDLSGNLIAQVDKYAFVGLVELRELSMSRNHLIRLMSQVGLAFCNAPMNQLQWLQFSDTLKDSSAQDPAGVSRLPNQMFICCPNLRSLQLNALQLRYLQVNAFDNLQRLESLSLAGNYLEQVPSSSLSYSNSNISRTLRHLDLSETLIEFVNAHALESLQSLEHLSLNHMQRLVSFDLAALHLKLRPQHTQLDRQHQLQTLQHQQTQSRLGHLGPEEDREDPAPSDYWATPPLNDETNLRSSNSIINHSTAPTSQQPNSIWGPLINDQLVELNLRHNLRLQSVHSSLGAGSRGGAGRRIRFTKLRELNLAECPEIRELPLSQMLLLPTLTNSEASSPLASDDLHDNNLRIDLSCASSKLNCSSCHMGWLLEAATRQLSGGAQTIIGPQTAAFNPEPQPYLSIAQQRATTVMQRPQQHHFHANSNNNRSHKPANVAIVVSQLESLACQFPYPMSLVQFVSLQQTASPESGGLVSQCPPEDEQAAEDAASSLSNNLSVGWSSLQEGSTGGTLLAATPPEVPWISLALSILAVVAVLLLALKLGTGLVSRVNGRREAHTYQHASDALGHFKWGPPAMATSLTGCSPASSQQSSSGHMCNPGADYSSASILSSSAVVPEHCGLASMHQASLGQAGSGGLLGNSAYHHPSWQVGKGLACSTSGTATDPRQLIDFKGFRESEREGPHSIVVALPASTRGPNLLSRLAARLAPGWSVFRPFGRSHSTAHSQLTKPTLLPHTSLAHLNQAPGPPPPGQDVRGAALFQHHQANQRHLLPSAEPPSLLPASYAHRFNYSGGQTQPAPEVPPGLVYSNLQQPPPESTSYRVASQNQLHHEEEKRRLLLLDMSASQQQQRHLLEAIGGDQKYNLVADLKLAGPQPATCSAGAYLEPINVISSSNNNNNTTTCHTTQVSHHSTTSSVVNHGNATNLLAESRRAIPLTDAHNHHKHLREPRRLCRPPERATLSQAPLDAPEYTTSAGSGGQVGERHIYVTLDRPIKQQNGPDEYSAVYEQPQAGGDGGCEARQLSLKGDQTAEAASKSFQWSEPRGGGGGGDKFGCLEEQHLVAAGQQMTTPAHAGQSSRLSFQAAMENTRQQLLGQSGDPASSLESFLVGPEKPAACQAANVTGHSDCLAGLAVVASPTGSGATEPLSEQQQPFMARNGCSVARSEQQLRGGRAGRKKVASATDANGPSNRRQQASCGSKHDDNDDYDHVINGSADCNNHKPATQDVAAWNQTMIGRQRVPSAESRAVTARRRLSAHGLPTVEASSLSNEISAADNGKNYNIDQSIDAGRAPDYIGPANQQEMACDSPPTGTQHSEQTNQVINRLTSDTYSNQFYYCRPQSPELTSTSSGGPTIGGRRKSRR